MTNVRSIETGSAAYSGATDVETYRESNRALVELAAISPGAVVVDLGCGPGGILELLVDQGQARMALGVDDDPIMIDEARKRIGPRAGYLCAHIDEVDALFPSGSVDAVLLGNCVHLLDDIGSTFERVMRVLVPGGLLAFSTAFFDGAVADEDRAPLVRLLLQARRILREDGQHPSARPSRGNASRRELSKEYFTQALGAAGFSSVDMQTRELQLPDEFLISLVSTPMFASGVLPSVAPDYACDVMRRAMLRLIGDRRPDEANGIRRTTLYGLARKPRSS